MLLNGYIRKDAVNTALPNLINRCVSAFSHYFIAGAKWQACKMYTENDVRQFVKLAQATKNYGDYKPYTFEECLTQFNNDKMSKSRK